jgi:hypothetical protein
MSLKNSNKERFSVPGTIVECKSGRYLAFYEHRTDIIANGDSEIEAKKNLKKLYNLVKKNENIEFNNVPIKLPKAVKTKDFVEKLQSV